ncbi:MAG: tetratricopeptide repeat protein [Pseudomonadota bacterium]
MPLKSFILIYSVLLFFSIVFTGCSDTTDKAKEFMSAGMYPQAIELLDKRIAEKPADANAHFQLGVCYINTGNLSGANERFASAVQLKSDYGYKIGPEYKKAGSQALTKGDMSRAIGLYRQAVQYQPALKNDIGTELVAEGKALFEKGQHKIAENYFMASSSINPDIKESIADYYFQAGNKTDASTDLKTICIDSAVKFSQKESITKAYSDYHYELSKQAKTTEQAIEELKRANQSNKQYSAELLAKQEQLIQEQFLDTVKKYEAEFGSAKKVELTERGKWAPVCTIPTGSMIYYLSLNEFKAKDNFNGERVWRASSTQKYARYRITGSEKLYIEFSMKDKPTSIYYWAREQ